MDVPPLNYAPRPPTYRSRRVRRLIRLIALPACVLGIGWLVARPAWRHAEILYWQSRAMHESMPAGLLVYDNAPGNISDRENVAFFVASSWCQLIAICSPPGPREAPMLFLHNLKTPDSRRRLVACELRGLDMRIIAQVVRPGTLFASPQLLNPSAGSWVPPSLDDTRGRRVRFYAGQPDLSDPSHFTIPLDVGGRRHLIDGWLTNDDRVTLEERNESPNSGLTPPPR